jgi:hypothetical protein
VNLSSPLTTSDELDFTKAGEIHTLGVTAGVHRQTWVAGNSIFVDVHVLNNSPKTIKKISLQIEKVTSYFDSCATATNEGTAEYLRVPDHSEKRVVAYRTTKKEDGVWQGISPGSLDERTCYLDIPQGLVTINTGKL